MKKLILLLFILPFIAYSQEEADSTKVWKFGGTSSINFSQVSLTNWVAGGKSSASGTFLFNSYANYQKDIYSWENALDLGYGLLKEDGNQAVKTDDKIDFSSKFGVKSKGKIFYTALFNFRSQFTNGYNYPDRDNEISKFFAPGYFTFAIGLDYKPNEHFSVFLSPITTKMTVVTDQVLADAGAFGVDPGKKSRSELGAFVKVQLKQEIVKNVSLETKIDLFSNYIDNPENIDIHWDVLINMKINDFLSANLITNMIYDDDVDISIDNDGDGNVDEIGPRVQFKELFGVGFSVKF